MRTKLPFVLTVLALTLFSAACGGQPTSVSDAMKAEAARVAEDGGSIGTSMVMWMSPPHFYKLGRMMVLYVGDDQTIRDLLEGVFGSQFARR